MSVLGDDEAPLPAIPDRLIVPCFKPDAARGSGRRMDRTSGSRPPRPTLVYVSEIMEGLTRSSPNAWMPRPRRREAAGGEACWGLEERQLGSRGRLVRFFWYEGLMIDRQRRFLHSGFDRDASGDFGAGVRPQAQDRACARSSPTHPLSKAHGLTSSSTTGSTRS